MSRRRVYSEDTLDIMRRFFDAIEICKEKGLLKNYASYFAERGIAKNHFYLQRKDLNRGFFEVGWLVPLIRDCGVSAYWLMTGQGTMFLQ
jgi:hypothetical protein